MNFGSWDVIKTREKYERGYFNRKVEMVVADLCGVKSLYSESYYAPTEFWVQYNKTAYDRLKARYDPEGKLGDLYAKCVLRQ